MHHRSRRGRRMVAALTAGVMGACLVPLLAAAEAIDTAEFCRDAPAGKRLSDVRTADIHFDGIACLSALGITEGTTAGTYLPGSATTRGQMASFIARFIDTANALALTDLEELPATADDAFPDDDGNTHEDAINRLAAAGIVEGRTDGTYGPDETVNRSQMASYIVRAIEFLTGEELPAGTDAFPDDDESLHEANINKLAAADIVEGKTDGTYAPGEPVTRSQMASYIVRALSVLHAAGDIGPVRAPVTAAPVAPWEPPLIPPGPWTPPGPPEPPEPPAAGEITLDATTVVQGGLVSGTIGNASTLESLTVQGCGLALTDLSVNGATGTFSFQLPSDDWGACVLELGASWTNGSSAAPSFAITVLALPGDGTDTAGLMAATYSPGSDQVLFHFDEPIASILSGAVGQFHVYGMNGVALSAIDADILPADPTTVIATFPGDLGPALGGFAARAALDKDTVEDAEGNLNYPDFAPLVNQRPGITVGPDLVSVDNIRTDALGRIVADFTFDQAVQSGGGIDPTAFYVAEKSTAPLQVGATAPGVFRGLAEIERSDDGRTVTIHFGDTAFDPTPNTAEIVRGIVEAGAVNGVAAPFAPNVLQVEGACVGGGPIGTCTPITASDGTANGKTDTPDIVSAVPGGNSSLRVTFDEPVDADSLNSFAFVAYNGDLTPIPGTAALRSATDTKVVDVDFPAGSLVDAVILTIEDAVLNGGTGPGVVGTTGEQQPNISDEVAIGASPAGTTALADLLSVTAKQLPNGGWVVEFKFDSAPGAALAGQFYLVDVEGTLTPNAGGVTAGNSVFITTDVTTATALGLPVGAVGFEVGDIDDAVLGAVDEVHPGSNPTFTEGEAPLVKTPLP